MIKANPAGNLRAHLVEKVGAMHRDIVVLVDSCCCDVKLGIACRREEVWNHDDVSEM